MTAAPKFPFDILPTDVLLSLWCCGSARRSRTCCVFCQREELRWELQVGAVRRRFTTEVFCCWCESTVTLRANSSHILTRSNILDSKVWRPKEAPLPKDFDFAAYLSLRFGQVCAEIVEVPAATWISLWGVLLLVTLVSFAVDTVLTPLLTPLLEVLPTHSVVRVVLESLPMHSIVANVLFYVVLFSFIPLARRVARAFHMLVPQSDPMCVTVVSI